VCDAIEFAHSRGVIHRDIKPANILVGVFGEVFVMDWGLAKVLPSASIGEGIALGREENLGDLDPEGMAIGTLQYLSPEQARGDHDLVDERTDVFLLGGVLYFILTNKSPYAGLQGREAVLAAQEARVAPPQERVSDIQLPPALCAIAMKALARDPAHRFQSVAQLRQAVRKSLLAGRFLPQRSYPKGTTIVREGEAGNEAFVIVTGRCHVYKIVNGAKVVRRRLGPGEVFGEMAVVSAKTRAASVEAAEDVTVMVVSEAMLKEGVGLNSWFGIFVKALVERFREADERLTELETSMLDET
jgi:serine/threonine-protein kinase